MLMKSPNQCKGNWKWQWRTAPTSTFEISITFRLVAKVKRKKDDVIWPQKFDIEIIINVEKIMTFFLKKILNLENIYCRTHWVPRNI